MKPLFPTQASQPSGMLEFEPVSIAAARATASELPSGVENMLDKMPGYWHKVRRGTIKRDLVLTPSTIEWMRQLPKDIWPLQTGAAYPRVLNQLALCWRMPEERETEFERLLNSQRKQRRGFPKLVEEELRTLRLFSLGLISG
jgi:hypothetical protein